MTYKEKIHAEHPEISIEMLEDIYCPSDFGCSEPDSCVGMICADCWDREMLEEE